MLRALWYLHSVNVYMLRALYHLHSVNYYCSSFVMTNSNCLEFAIRYHLKTQDFCKIKKVQTKCLHQFQLIY